MPLRCSPGAPHLPTLLERASRAGSFATRGRRALYDTVAFKAPAFPAPAYALSDLIPVAARSDPKNLLFLQF